MAQNKMRNKNNEILSKISFSKEMHLKMHSSTSLLRCFKNTLTFKCIYFFEKFSSRISQYEHI